MAESRLLKTGPQQPQELVNPIFDALVFPDHKAVAKGEGREAESVCCLKSMSAFEINSLATQTGRGIDAASYSMHHSFNRFARQLESHGQLHRVWLA